MIRSQAAFPVVFPFRQNITYALVFHYGIVTCIVLPVEYVAHDVYRLYSDQVFSKTECLFYLISWCKRFLSKFVSCHVSSFHLHEENQITHTHTHTHKMAPFWYLMTRQEADSSRRQPEDNPKAPFSLTSPVTYAREGWAPLQSRCMHNLSPVLLVLISPTTNGWKAE